MTAQTKRGGAHATSAARGVTVSAPPLLGPAALRGYLHGALAEAEDVAEPLRSWRRAYACTAAGAYGEALTLLEEMPRTSIVVEAAAGGLRASLLRQVSLHALAAASDEAALRLLGSPGARQLDGVGAAAVEASLRIGLVADGVGLGIAYEELVRRLAVAAAGVAASGDWRQTIRITWVQGEVAATASAWSRAETAFGDGLRRARRHGAVRHEVKTLGFLAAIRAASGALVAARELATQAAEQAARLGAKPLVWPCLLVLSDAAARLGDDEGARGARERAAAVLGEIVDSLPPPVQREARLRYPAAGLLS